MIDSKINTAFIALGSNIGDKLNYLKSAVKLIHDDKNCLVEKASSVFETKPYGVKNQDNFFNAVIQIKTEFIVLNLLTFLKNLEKEIGREKGMRWGPREIDLDILFYNNLIYTDERLTVPHKEIEQRDFVLTPLKEIAAQFIHPALNVKISDIYIESSESNIIRKIPEKIF